MRSGSLRAIAFEGVIVCVAWDLAPRKGEVALVTCGL